eukprot:11223657-Lingulodinium_polyedra.AAC.1
MPPPAWSFAAFPASVLPGTTWSSQAGAFASAEQARQDAVPGAGCAPGPATPAASGHRGDGAGR